MVIFFIGCHGCGGIFCMGSFPRSYEYGKIRVRLMRTEGNGNENEGHFVSVGARRGTAYFCCVISARQSVLFMLFAICTCLFIVG